MIGTPLLPTEAEQRVLRAIEALIDRDGMAPTVRQLAAHCGYANHGMVAALIDRLEERGWLSRTPGRARGLVLLRRLPRPGIAGDVVTLPATEYYALLAAAGSAAAPAGGR